MKQKQYLQQRNIANTDPKREINAFLHCFTVLITKQRFWYGIMLQLQLQMLVHWVHGRSVFVKKQITERAGKSPAASN